jgi:hypothetical protein
MATANSKLKIDFGFDSLASSNIGGNLRVEGDLFINGAIVSTITTTGDLIPNPSGLNLGNTTNRWTVVANSGNFSNVLTVTGSTSLQDTLTVTKTLNASNNVIITGFANAVVSVNSALLTVGSNFIANVTGVFHTGTVNAASYTTTGFVANTTAVVPTSNTVLLGNSIGRFVLSANTGNFSGDVTITGNTTVNNATLNGTVQTISGNVNFDSGTVFIDSANNRLGIGTITPGVTLDVVGSANVSISVNSALLTVGGSFIANASGAYHTGVINAASHTVGTSTIVNSTYITSSGSANLTALDSTIRVGNSTVNAFVNSTLVAIGTGNFSVGANVGANVSLTNTSILVGNSTVNSSITNSLVSVANSTSSANISPNSIVIGSFVANNLTMNANNGNFAIGANVGANVSLSTSSIQVGNSTINLNANSTLVKVSDATSTANLSSSSLTIGSAVVNSTVLTIGTGNFSTAANVGANVNLTTSTLQIGNSSVNTQVNSSVFSTGTGTFSSGANVGANVNLSTVLISVGNSTINSTVNSTVVMTGTLIAGNSTQNTFVVNAAGVTLGNSTVNTFLSIGRATALACSAVTIEKIYALDATTYGLYSNVTTNNTTVTAARQTIGIQSFVTANTLNANATGGVQSSEIYGIQSIVQNAPPAGGNSTIDYAVGSYGLARNYGNGSAANTLSNAEGVRGTAQQVGSGVIAAATGVIGTVNIANTTVTGNVTAAYGVRSTIQSNTAATIATGYLFYGAHLGSTTTTKYGLYVTGESNNYFSNNVYIAGTALTLGTSFVANTLGVYHVGTSNATSYTVGTQFTSNSTGTYVNSGILTVGSSLVSNTTGTYSTGIVNAASHTIGTSFIANTTVMNHTGTLSVGNSTVNSFVNSSFLSIRDTVSSTNVGVNSIISSNIASTKIYSTGEINLGAWAGAPLTTAWTSSIFMEASTGIIQIDKVGGVVYTDKVKAAGGSYEANTTGFYTSGKVNAASLTVGTNFIANTTGIWSTGDITAFYSSDERLKSNIVNIESALDKVMQLNGVMHDWNDTALELYPDRTYRDVGVIAQQVERVLPEIVITRDTGFKAVRYERLIPLLIEAIKELKQEINELKNGNS